MSGRMSRLEGRVVVIGLSAPDTREAALACAAEGAAVVLVGADDGTAGAVAREVVDAGGRAAVFVGALTDPDDRAALAEMLAELF
jgi:NAD(P)-dependent dehydrogenase (short-subunit alcohol dehydrogenase family)